MKVIQNKSILKLIKSQYTLEEFRALHQLLKESGTFSFSTLPNGLFSATIQTEMNEYSGYANVWIRDNVQIAYAHYTIGEIDITAQNLRTLMSYFTKYKYRFEQIIFEKYDFQDPMKRPHVRFEGIQLAEIDQKWAHAQNDALGYFLWMYSNLILDDVIVPSNNDIEMLFLVIAYFEHIQYWNDEDSGHWEEIRKINASSIGVVVAGLTVFKKLCITNKVPLPFVYKGKELNITMIDGLIEYGLNALKLILPSECIQSDAYKKRRYDAALLFLIYPLHVVDEDMEEQILSDVISNLQGIYGIRRYLGDSFWSANYKEKLKPEERTVDFSDNIASRDSLLGEGEEAQWCLFDPVVSIIYGEKFARTLNRKFFDRQVLYLNRSLGQLTACEHEAGQLKCPELYYLENGKYVTNDVVPLLWAQANLLMAMNKMEDSIKRLP